MDEEVKYTVLRDDLNEQQQKEEQKMQQWGCFLWLVVIVVLTAGCVSTVRPRSSLPSHMAAQAEIYRKNHSTTPVPATPIPGLDPSTLEVPCIGMKEADINKTQHPKLFRVTVDTVVMQGLRVTHYSDAYAAQDIPCSFTLKCENGVVTEICDYRDSPKPIIHYTPKKKTPSPSADSDNDYFVDAEEFYYYHMEEFESFEEAEDYYYDYYLDSYYEDFG